MPSDLIAISEAYRAELRAREAAAVERMAQGYAALANSLDDGIAKLYAQIDAVRKAGGDVSVSAVMQMDRYKDLMAQVNAELQRLGEQGAQEIANLQAEGIRIGMELAEAQLQALQPAGVSIPFNQLPTGTLEQMIGNLADGSPLAALLKDMGAETAKRISELLTQGIGMGWNPRKTAAAMHKELGTSLTRAMRIARTEQLRAWRQSSLQGYRDQGALIKGYRRVAALDSRTCIACVLMNGHFYELQADFTDHIQGRCAIIPVTRSWNELGFPDIPDTNPQVPDGREWFLGLDEATQRSMLGKSSYEAWKEGKISLDDLIGQHRSSKWGDSWQQVSTKQALENAKYPAGGP